MKKRNVRTIALLTICLSICASSSIISFAADYTGPTADFNSATRLYSPESGYLSSRFYDETSDKVKTYAYFTASNSNITDINKYRNGTGAYGGGKVCYFTVDVRNIRANSTGMDALSSYTNNTNLPNPKHDFENDNPYVPGYSGDNNNEEAECVVLGSMSAKSYYLETWWNDYRNSTTYPTNGDIRVSYSMSTEPTFSGGDYNSKDYEPNYRAQISYNSTAGRP